MEEVVRDAFIASGDLLSEGVRKALERDGLLGDVRLSIGVDTLQITIGSQDVLRAEVGDACSPPTCPVARSLHNLAHDFVRHFARSLDERLR